MEDIKELSEVSKTLFIPLAVRAKETLGKNPIFIDKMAVDILNQCDIRDTTIYGGEISTHGILARTKVIDEGVRTILHKKPHAIVINLGAGLDTRFFRVDNGTVEWYDLDLTEVISLRKQFITENQRLHFIAKSVLDKTWTKDINYTPEDTVIIIAEGLLMYFSQSEVKEILGILTSSFKEADVFFDVVHRFFVGKKISSDFLWGIDRASQIHDLNQEITILQSFCAGNLLKERQSFLFRILNVFPSTRKRSQIIHMKLKG